MGLDRQALCQQLFEGRQAVADTSVNPLDWVYSQDVPKYHEDLKAAGALLDQAGWSELRGGIRHNAKGQPLTLELMTTAGNRTRELVEQVLQSQWKRLGIDVRIRNEPARVFFGETVRKRKYSAMALFAWISSPENVPRTTLHSDQIPTADNGWAGQNDTGFRNAEMDKLIEAVERELDRDKRKAMWAAFAADLRRGAAGAAALLPLRPVHLAALAHGVVPTGHQDYSTLWVEHWRAETS